MAIRNGRQFLLPVVILTLAVTAGCSDGKLKIYPVSGQIMYNGQPLKGVEIAFHPTDAKNDTGYPPHGKTDADGKFILTTYVKDDGAPAGEFKLAIAFAVEAVEEGADQSKKLSFQVPAKYHKAETSGLTAVVKPESNVLDPFRLEGPPAPKGK
jgi:hypothetical protein